MSEGRLFVPVTSNAFRWYLAGKTWEIRRYSLRWSKGAVVGRVVEIRLGYSGASLWGRVRCVVTGTLDRVLARIGPENVIPRGCVAAIGRRDAIAVAIGARLTEDPQVIAFQVFPRKGGK